MSTIGSFTPIKNEAYFIAPHLLSWLPHLDSMVFFDAGSTDGTIEIIKAIKQEFDHKDKIKLFENRDCLNLQESYTGLMDECMRSHDAELTWFLHPDQFPVENEALLSGSFKNIEVAGTVKMRSFAGNPGTNELTGIPGELLELKGRAQTWKPIARLKNPDLGPHYHGFYGAWNEDIYFRHVTGDEHILYTDAKLYPYPVTETGLEILHFSDVRTYVRRLSRMLSCLENQGWLNRMTRKEMEFKAKTHPRVSLKSSGDYQFVSAEYPKKFLEYKDKYKHLERPKCGMASVS